MCILINDISDHQTFDDVRGIARTGNRKCYKKRHIMTSYTLLQSHINTVSYDYPCGIKMYRPLNDSDSAEKSEYEMIIFIQAQSRKEILIFLCLSMQKFKN